MNIYLTVVLKQELLHIFVSDSAKWNKPKLKRCWETSLFHFWK